MALGLTQPETEVISKNLPGVHKADNFTAIYELIVLKM
jgi:hypothetical protein